MNVLISQEEDDRLRLLSVRRQMSGLGNDVSLMDCIFFFLSMTQFESGDAESCGKAAT